jgi:predicted PurR-regulated permease PerM
VTTGGLDPLGRAAPLGPAGGDVASGDPEAVLGLEQRVALLEAQLRAHRRMDPLGSRRVFSVLGMIVAVAACLALGYLAWKGITLVLVAVLFAVALNPAVEFFVCRGLTRGSAAALVFVLALCGIGALGLLLIPPLVRQISNFIGALPDLVASVNDGNGWLGDLERRFHVLEYLPGVVAGGSGERGVAGSGLDVVLGVLGTAAGTVIVAFLTFFMLLEGPTWVGRLLALIPEPSRMRSERVAYGIYRTVGGFVSGNLVASVLAGLTATVALVATGVSYAIPLGLLVGFLDLLPIFGMIVALVVMAVVSFAHSVVAGIVVVGLVFVYHQFEVYMLRPLIYGRTIELSPLAVLVAVVIGTELAGVLGALAAIPVAGSINVVICELTSARAEARQREILNPGV